MKKSKKTNWPKVRRILYTVCDVVFVFGIWISLIKSWLCPMIVSGQPPFMVSPDSQIVISEDSVIDGGSSVYFELRPLNNHSIPAITAKLKPAELGGSELYFLKEEVIKAGRYAVKSTSSQKSVTLFFQKETKVTIYRSNLILIINGLFATFLAFLMGCFLFFITKRVTMETK